MSPPVGSYHLQPSSPFIIITQPESWYSFTVPRRVEGWVDLGTAGRVHTARAKAVNHSDFYDKHNYPQHESIPHLTHCSQTCYRQTTVTWIKCRWRRNVKLHINTCQSGQADSRRPVAASPVPLTAIAPVSPPHHRLSQASSWLLQSEPAGSSLHRSQLQADFDVAAQATQSWRAYMAVERREMTTPRLTWQMPFLGEQPTEQAAIVIPHNDRLICAHKCLQ